MISRYDGRCSICGKPTKAGTDEYDLESKKSFHRDCQEKRDLFSASEAEELAERLGYRHISWDELYDRLGLGSEVRVLPGDTTGGSTGRTERETHGRDALWPVSAGDPGQDDDD